MQLRRHLRNVDRYLFETWAPLYDESILQPLLFVPTHAAVLDAAGSRGTPLHDILDVGCGTGRLLGRAGDRWPNARLVGVDVASNMIAEAKGKYRDDARFRFEVGDAAALPLTPDSIDVAFSTLSFHHWGDQAGGLRQVARVLRLGGLFVLADIRPPLLLGRVLRRLHAEDARQSLFEACGFSVVEQRRPPGLGGQVLMTVGRKT
jgi:ubiquinone/menaquinone biosynthesis C-methylase UbiE